MSVRYLRSSLHEESNVQVQRFEGGCGCLKSQICKYKDLRMDVAPCLLGFIGRFKVLTGRDLISNSLVIYILLKL